MNRRQFVALAPAALALADESPKSRWPIVAFSKHFQWTTVPEMAAYCAEMGYDGIDLTLRPGGHIEPATVADALPKAAEAIRAQKLSMPRRS